jgi:hypothetical protein
MKKILGCFAILTAACLTSSVASAGTACAAGENILASGFSCTIGSLTFSNFSSTNYNETFGGVITLDIGTVTSNGFTLQTILPTNGNPSFNDANLQFEVAGGVSGVGLSLNGAPSAFVTENVCKTQQSAGSGNCALGDLLAYLTAFGNGGTPSVSFSTTDPIWIFKDIADGGFPMSETTQIYTASTVPEPMTLSMMGVGLLGLSLISRRKKS